MVEIMKISNCDEIRNLIEIIHDYWFDLEDLIFNKELRYVTIQLRKNIKKNTKHKTQGMNRVQYAMMIKNVIFVNIEDTEKVGSYDINTVHYDAGKNIMHILTGIPLQFDIGIKELEIILLENK